MSKILNPNISITRTVWAEVQRLATKEGVKAETVVDETPQRGLCEDQGCGPRGEPQEIERRPNEEGVREGEGRPMSEAWLEAFIRSEAKRLKEIIEKNGSISLLPPTKRGEAAEHMVEFRLLEEGILCWPVKARDARDRIIFDPLHPEKSSSIQIKYINYATAGSHGAYLQFSELLIKSPEKPNYIIICEDPIGEYRYFVLMNAEMQSELQDRGKQRSSDPKRVPRRRLYIPRNLDFLVNYEDRFKDLEVHPRHNDPM